VMLVRVAYFVFLRIRDAWLRYLVRSVWWFVFST